MKFIIAVLICLFSFAAQAEVPVASQRTTVTKPHSRLPVKRSQKILIRAAVAPGDIDDTDTDSDGMDIYIGYRRPELSEPIQLPSDDPDLSDYVQLRLLIARTRALKKFAEVQSNLV